MTALHVFDMDGTLLRGTTASHEISRHLGCEAALAELERAWAGGAITEPQFAQGVHELWSELTVEVVAEVVLRSPWIDGVAEVCADIAARGETSMLITMSPDFFARHIERLGVVHVRASRFPAVPFLEALDPAGILQPADKVRLAEELRMELGLPRERVVAYGDSVSDVPLFDVLEHTVAVNADEHLEGRATATYRGDDLRGAYAIARGLLDGAA